MGIKGKFASFYFYGSFLWLQITINEYARKIVKEFIHIALFYDYKFSKMGISKILKWFIHIALFYDYK